LADDEDMLASATAVVWAVGKIANWLPTVVRLLELPDIEGVVVVTDDPAFESSLPSDSRVRTDHRLSFRDVAVDTARATQHPLLLVTSPVLLPLVGLGSSRRIMAADMRVASVSFLCNAAGHLSFPHPNKPTRFAFEGHDETSLTRRLRESDPRQLPVPIAATAGPATLVSRDAVLLTGGPAAEFAPEPEIAVAEMLLRAARRGMRVMLDPDTYVTRPWEDWHWGPELLAQPPLRRRLHELHPFFPSLHRAQRADPESPLSLALRTSRAKAQGLRILIDASCLGPVENGTQVQTLALIGALSRRDDVRWLGAAVAGPVPRYAQTVLGHPKVEVLRTTSLRFGAKVARADILHRPFQPSTIPWKNWRGVADRILITVQDLIAYNIGAYYVPQQWLRYREAILQGVSRADGVVVISHDVADNLHEERLPVSSERLFVVENGTDHLTGHEEDAFPAELHARGWAARPFLLVLGANYAHKNRDLAIRVFKQLRERHPSLGLVLAGVSVPEGSSRVLEAAEGYGEDGIVAIPDVTSEERNWLLRHASICLYPTSAEGFGLVPFEAARFGTPTVHARFGPLAEVLPGVPVAASSWDPAELASCCDELLSDPQRAQEQVDAILKAGTRYTWDATAEQLVSAYRSLLSQPARSTVIAPPRKENHG
jgi:glycosyltransferase involved in cell wall biosynthesis